MSVGNRLSLLIKELKISKKSFADALNISPGNLSDWISPKRKSNPTTESLTRIYEIYNINLHWLLTGEGEMFVNKDSNAECNKDEVRNLKKKLADLSKKLQKESKEIDKIVK
jgi:transcriptional regulator with XRE-family HTH domain